MVIVVVAMTVTVTVVIVIMIATVIAVMVVIPFVIVLDTALPAFPVTVVEASFIVARADPAGTLIRRAAPIAFMPAIVPAHGIPVTINPNKLRTRAWRVHVYDSRLRRTTDSDADSNLRACGVAAEQQHCGKQRKSGEVSHFL